MPIDQPRLRIPALRSGTIITILYVKEGLIIATDSVGIAEKYQPRHFQKIFEITSRMGCVLMGIAHIEDTDTGEEAWLGSAIIQSASSLQSTHFSESTKQISAAFQSYFQTEKARLKVTFKEWKEPDLSELLFVGFDDGTALLQRVYFGREKEKLCDPIFEEPFIFHEPYQYVRYWNVGILPLLKADPLDWKKLPQQFSLIQAEHLARTYVEAAINSGDRKVGGKIQLAKIPRDGKFSFVTPPVNPTLENPHLKVK